MQKIRNNLYIILSSVLILITVVSLMQLGFSQLNDTVSNNITNTTSNDDIDAVKTTEIPSSTEASSENQKTNTAQTNSLWFNNKSLTAYRDTIVSFNLSSEQPNDVRKFDYFVTMPPKNGFITKTPSESNPDFNYKSKKDFTGIDNFTIEKHNRTNNGLIENTHFQVSVLERSISVPLFWDNDPNSRAIIAMAISFVVTAILFLIVWKIIIRHKCKGFKTYFSDILRTADWDPSLSMFQFLVWTAVILFSFLGLYFVRVFSGVTESVQGGIPVNVLGLMGISIAVPLLSQYITSSKKGPGTLTDAPPPEPRPSLSLMLYENNQPSLSRFQLFAWTWISIVIYLNVLFTQIHTNMSSAQNLLLPDIDPTLLLLMGLSNFAFLGVKAQNNKMQITSIFPEMKIPVNDPDFKTLNNKIILPTHGDISIGCQSIGEVVSIFGTNFSHQMDKIWFDDKAYPFEGSDVKNEITWQPTGDRIDLKVPALLEPKLYLVRVANNGFLSDPYIIKILPKKA